MSSKVALISDIHGNSPALRAVLSDIQNENCTEVFMLGDIINGMDPHGCVDLLRTWAEVNHVKLDCIKGNAEAYLTTPDYAAVPDHGADWNQGMIALIRWFEDHLTASDLDWMRGFPDTLRWKGAYLVHDSPLDRLAVQTQSDPAIEPQYREWFYHGPGILPDRTAQEWEKLLRWMEGEPVTKIFCGHTHVPFCREIGNRIICNVGSVGAPLDGDPRGSWVLLESMPSGQEIITIRRVEYDLANIHQRIDDIPDYPDFGKTPGFREAYKQWLATGTHWREHLAHHGQ